MAELKNINVTENARFINTLITPKISELETPEADKDIVTKSYVDGVFSQI